MLIDFPATFGPQGYRGIHGEITPGTAAEPTHGCGTCSCGKNVRFDVSGRSRIGRDNVENIPCPQPAYPGYFADPFVWRHEGEYYAIGTGPQEADGNVVHASEPSVFPVLRSRDLSEWDAAGRALIAPDASLGSSFWAPEIAWADGHWHLYYSVGHGDHLHQLRVAISNEPLGPYVDCAQLTDPVEIPFAIDPHPFKDDDGRWYLFHARDYLDTNEDAIGAVRAGTALTVGELESMTRLSRRVTTVLRARCDWQRFASERTMYGRVFDWHTLEGPCVVRERGRYYCLYSGGCWQTETYGLDYTVSDRVLGPYEQIAGEPHARLLRTIPGALVGPGHCSVAPARDGSGRIIAYHAWDPAMTARRMYIDELVFDENRPRVVHACEQS
jgi:GH43 family beta-xylosidase